MAKSKKILSGVLHTEVIERNRQIRKLSRRIQRVTKAVLRISATQKKSKAAAVWKTWKKVARALSATIALQHSTLRHLRQNVKELR